MSKLTLAEVNAVLRQCGCCEYPTCCPPIKECRQIPIYAEVAGFDDESISEDSDTPLRWERPKYQKRVRTWNGTLSDSFQEDYPGSGFGTKYVRKSITDARNFRQFDEPHIPFYAYVCNVTTGDVEYKFKCEFLGSYTERYFDPYFDDTWKNFLSLEEVVTYEDIEGQHTEQHIEWEAEKDQWDEDHPDFDAEQEAYDDAYQAYVLANKEWEEGYVAWNASFNAYLAAHNAWVAGGSVGAEPQPPADYPDPPSPPEPLNPRPPEPPKFYGPCTMKATHSRTLWDRVGVDGGKFVIKLTESDDSEFTNPQVWHEITVPVIPYGPPQLESPITPEQFHAQAEQWFTDHYQEAFDRMELDPSDSDYCPPGTRCGAEKYYTSGLDEWRAAVGGYVFWYRFKLNKCCGFKKISSGWREVFWPRVYLEWLDLIARLDSDEVAPPPPVDLESLATKKQWQWEGVAPLCNESVDSDEPPVDPYDYKPMWSPWSAVTKVPNGEQGRLELRNYFQICYGTLMDVMPAVLGEVDLSDDEPDIP